MLSVFDGVYGSAVVLKLICLTLTGINLSYYNKISDGSTAMNCMIKIGEKLN